MKRCPECGREYDNTMMFCLDDGAELLYGPARSEPSASAGGQYGDEPQTAILHSTAAPGEAPTRAQIHTTEQTAVLPGRAEAEPQESRDRLSERQSLSANRAAQPQGSVSSTRAKPLIAALVVAVLVLMGGFFGYRYFSSPSGGQINSIAVMPFENRNSDADTDYLSDGLAESVIFRLTQLPDLRVSPTSSVMRYKGKETDVAKIASELGVDAVMTGRLTKRGDNLNITVELVDARTNKSLWGEQYERKLSELLTTQRDIVTEIVGKLQLKLSGESEQKLAKKYTDNNEAYQLYLKGRFHFAKRTKADMERSIELLKQATELDPFFALAYVGIAESYTSMPSYPYMSPQDAAPKAKEAIERALALDPMLPEAHAVAGMIAVSAWDYAKAESAFKRALELGPDLAIVHYRYGWIYLSAVGRHDEAVAEMKRAMELEPLAIQQGANYAAVLIYARRFDEAVAAARKAYELDKNHIGAQNWLCHALNAKGLSAEALELFEGRRSGQDAATTSFIGCLGVAYAKTGQRQKALDIIAQANEAKKSRYVMTYWTAVIYAALGEKEKAFAELEESFRNRDWFLNRAKVDPLLDPLRDDPRFKELVKRVGIPE